MTLRLHDVNVKRVIDISFYTYVGGCYGYFIAHGKPTECSISALSDSGVGFGNKIDPV